MVRSNAHGELLRLKDIANVEFGSSMYDIYSNLNGRPSAAIVLKQSFGSNANQVIEDVKAKLEKSSKNSQKEWIMKSLMTFLNSLMLLSKK